MTEIKTIYHKIYSDNSTRDPKHFIDIYEANINLIEGADTSTANPNYDEIIRITSDYALSLSHYGSSRKAIRYLEKAIQLFKDSSYEDLTKVIMYEILVWTRGVENFNLKKYSLATKDFQYLVVISPDNDKYRNWLLVSKTIKAKKYLNFLWFGSFACVVWETILKTEDRKLKDYLFITAIVLCGLAIIVEIFNSLVKSRIKKQ